MTDRTPIQTNLVLGWDVGGAHLKAALVDAGGSALTVVQVACPLWRGLNLLRQAVNDILQQIESAGNHLGNIRHAVTMTGELADIFPDRLQGVAQISSLMLAQLGQSTRFYAGKAGLVDAIDIPQYAAEIASANWLASAEFVAHLLPQGLFADIGSTTADFVLFRDKKVHSRGSGDGERMQYEELVYSGVVRTPLMALGSRIPFAGEWQTLAAEHFATTADIYRLTGDLDGSEDMVETADGAGKTPEESARRIARMIGRDFQDAPLSDWKTLAEAFKQNHLNILKHSVMRHISRCLIEDHAPLVGAGAGNFLVREIARQLNREYHDISSLISAKSPETKNWAGICLPAYAVACKAAREAT